MAAETQAAETGQSVNGTGPVPAEEPCEDCATGFEKIMGLFMLGLALGGVFIAVDLITGQALSRMIFPARTDDAAG